MATGKAPLLLSLLTILPVVLSARPVCADPGLPPNDPSRIERTDPDHARKGPYDPSPKPAIAPERPPVRTPDRIVYAFEGPASAQLTPRPELSTACRNGVFRQRVDMLYRAFGTGERPLGVAYGRSAINLIDFGGRRAEDEVYFFDKQDTGLCRVWSARRDDIRRWYVRP